MQLLVCRHVSPSVAVAGLCYGARDLPVDAAQAAAAAHGWSEHFDADMVYSSPLKRCELSARYWAVDMSLPLLIEERLTELDFGTWEGRRWDDIARAELDAWVADFAHYAPGGGESVAALFARVDGFLAHLRTAHAADAKLALITHAGVAGALAWRLQNNEARLPLANEWPPVRLAFGATLLLEL